MPIIRKEEQLPLRSIVMVIYGQAGVGKTSLANTAKSPILIDCDKGSDRAVNRTDTLVASTWDDILKDEGELANYKTVVIDTAKAVLDDFLSIWAVKQDYRLKNNKLRMFGEIGEQFKSFVNRCRSLDIDIIIISHVKEEKDGDVIKLSPDVTGQSKDLIIRIADQIGYISMVNNQRVISFDPTDNRVGKNTAKIEDVIIPDSTSPEFDNYLDSFSQRVKNAIQSLTKEQQEAISVARDIQTKIEAVKTAKEMNALLGEVNKLPLSQQKAIKNNMIDKGKAIGVTINKSTKVFEDATNKSNPA